MIPTLETERLILRAPRLSDWPILEPIFTTERGVHIGGPMSAKNAWLDFCQLTASWLLRGYGSLTITLRGDATVLGLIILGHEFGDPEPELGWLLTQDAEGNGYATEAAIAMHNEGLRHFGPGKFVSYITSGNYRSIKVAERLGATQDPTPHPANDDVLVYRHWGAA